MLYVMRNHVLCEMLGNITGSKIELEHKYIKIREYYFVINQHVILFSFSLNYTIISIN